MIGLDDLIIVVKALQRLQLDQVQSLADGETDEDQYNFDHVRTIIKTLEMYNNHPFDFSASIAFAKELIA
tara:strand:- start:11318 stop:11527 length:210 start_codon:yes stop_codon:yes gene_type:complete